MKNIFINREPISVDKQIEFTETLIKNFEEAKAHPDLIFLQVCILNNLKQVRYHQERKRKFKEKQHDKVR